METTTEIKQVTIHLPREIYRRVQRLSKELNRSLEDVLLDAIDTGLSIIETSGLRFIEEAASKN
ncbi:ribbon-helix-helix protein, CopG family [candidate division KSB1 bacterium]|nr:ribbon-helix-helix protein, CopG family [candidate division KSB1 bacterium]